MSEHCCFFNNGQPFYFISFLKHFNNYLSHIIDMTLCINPSGYGQSDQFQRSRDEVIFVRHISQTSVSRFRHYGCLPVNTTPPLMPDPDIDEPGYGKEIF